jgi:CRISPR-associated protein Csb2
MFAIAVQLLCERYTATQFNDRTIAEWPPHPARLFSAMVAAWGDNDEPDPAERTALRWLEVQDPPAIHCGQARTRRVVDHFVPVNDATALTRDISRSYAVLTEAAQKLREAEEGNDQRQVDRARDALDKAEARAIADAKRVGVSTGRESAGVAAAVIELLPEHRGKQGRTYPTVIPDESTVWFLWPDAQPDTPHRDALDRVLSRVGRIGHSSTFVSCRSVSDGPAATWSPTRGTTGLRLRVPRHGLVDSLEAAYASHRGEEPRTLPAGMEYYRQPSEQRPIPRSPLLGGDWYVLGITGRRLSSASQALAITRSARNALLCHSEQPVPEIISGHHGGGGGTTPPLDRPHLAVIPLLNAGNPRSDGTVFGIALVLPRDCPNDERSAVERAARTWSAAGFELLLPAQPGAQPMRHFLEDLGVERAQREPGWLETALSIRRKTTRRDYWCRPARRWVTVTPIALDRFPGDLRSSTARIRDRAENEAAESVARACVFAGLADSPEDVQVTVRLEAPLVGLPASPSNGPGRGRFPRYQTGSGTPRACVHAEIEFREPVLGPVLVGAGRYLGYGLCLPDDEKAARSS